MDTVQGNVFFCGQPDSAELATTTHNRLEFWIKQNKTLTSPAHYTVNFIFFTPDEAEPTRTRVGCEISIEMDNAQIKERSISSNSNDAIFNCLRQLRPIKVSAPQHFGIASMSAALPT